MNGTIFLAVVALSTVAAPQAIESGVLVPAQAPVRNAGTLDWSTGTWHRAAGPDNILAANAGGVQTIYDNTCIFSGGQMFVASQECWDRYDEGRIPTTVDPFNPGGLVCDCYTLCGFEVGYCTSEAPGGVQVQVGFYEGLTVSGVGGSCAGFFSTGLPPSGIGTATPPGNQAGPRDLYFDLTNVGLPADPTGTGVQNCWVVTVDLSNLGNGGFPFCGNGGDIVFDNVQDLDLFSWVWNQRGTTTTFGPTGPLLAGEPLKAAPGGCSFTLNCGCNVPGPGGTCLEPCGTGLGTTDNYWVNVDGSPVGSTGSTALCAIQASNGSNCYWFGGWPSQPYSSLHLKLLSNASTCAPGQGSPAPIVYCTAKASSSGCLAAITTSNPLAQPVSGANDYNVITNQIEGLKAGIFFHGISGMSAIPFNGGLLCVDPTGGLGRSPVQFSQGSLQNCDGTFTQRVNNMVLFNLDMGPGTSNWIQTWYRDPQLMDGFNTALSNAVQLDYQ